MSGKLPSGLILEMLSMPKGLVEELTRMQEESFLASTQLDRSATKLMVPDNMTLDQAIKVLQRKKDEEETKVRVHEVIEAFPFDAAHALTLVLQEQFGFSGTEATTIQTPFGPMTYAPDFIPVETSPGVITQVPFGAFCLPGIDGEFHMGAHRHGGQEEKEGRTVFCITGNVKGKHRSIVTKVAQMVRDKLKTMSIYKGKAIKVKFRDRDGDRINFSADVKPEFIPLLDGERAIFTEMTEAQIELSIFNPIRFTDRLKKNNMKIKRVVLLEGDYGTGKTLAAAMTAKECTKNGWTFLYVESCEDLDLAMQLAEQYAPAVVFAEDVDRVFGGDRDGAMDHLSYVIDGVDSKDKDVMVVLTTNNVKAIQKLMLRPGRIDSVISIQKPDLDTVWRLMKHYGGSMLLGDKSEFEQAIGPMVGQNAAFISEVINKAKLKALSREDRVIIMPDDVAVAVNLMQNHVELMNSRHRETNHRDVPLRDLSVRIAGHIGNNQPETSNV